MEELHLMPLTALFLFVVLLLGIGAAHVLDNRGDP